MREKRREIHGSVIRRWSESLRVTVERPMRSGRWHVCLLDQGVWAPVLRHRLLYAARAAAAAVVEHGDGTIAEFKEVAKSAARAAIEARRAERLGR